MDLREAVFAVFDRLEEFEEREFQSVLDRFREYPDGFKFYFAVPKDQGLEVCYVIEARLSGLGTGDIAIWYRCHVPSWADAGNGESIPLSGEAIARCIERFGVPS